METTAAQILKRKGGEVIIIGPAATVFEAIGRMVEHNVGSLVVEDGGEVRGIITERDYLRRIALEGRSSKSTRVEEVMTADVIHVEPSDTVEECMALMTEHKCRHLPVMRQGRLAGLISIGDCVRELLRAKARHVEDLTRYVEGQYPA